MQTQARKEDRRSCHNLSFILSLAVLARENLVADNCFVALVRLVNHVDQQEWN
jgi:hypothetical protein